MSVHVIHINLNMILLGRYYVEHSPSETIYVRYYMETNTHTHTDTPPHPLTHTHACTHIRTHTNLGANYAEDP